MCTAVPVVRVTLTEKGVSASSGCSPNTRYQAHPEGICCQLETLRKVMEARFEPRATFPLLLPPGSACNALDCVLWRLEVALLGQSL
ncbi:hypothetical protein [Sodalis-like endosymbiont of Proechinophthirus fluctus]|uniref:hypothetical protein n=1 Tax=Sodalis-like endosymbiont of Proechinophthirus fluctus TaxID=1462730 RepID=UPI001650562A|nr:hypothetical protein [Sodalis-like endosymbiont of Proechinophthirus fluctus]